MALTPSTMLELGTQAPDFSLPDTEGSQVSLSNFAGEKALLVMFICNHCPYVVHLKESLAAYAREMASQGLVVVAISSNDVDNYPDDSPAAMAKDHQDFGYTFPYLYDETQEVAKAYRAACTPDFYVFDGDQRLVYRGRYDESRPGNDHPITGRDLRQAVDATLSGQPMEGTQMPSLGCNIKWKPGNAPGYFGA
jgi:peroxiredoxin